MTVSTTIGHTAREVRATRTIRNGDDRYTIRFRPGRTNARRTAIAESLGYAR